MNSKDKWEKAVKERWDARLDGKGELELAAHDEATDKAWDEYAFDIYAKKTGRDKWLACKLYSTHPADSYLRVVIRDRAPLGYGQGYVVHTFNAEQGGYGNGDYCETWAEAIEAFNKRGSNR